MSCFYPILPDVEPLCAKYAPLPKLCQFPNYFFYLCSKKMVVFCKDTLKLLDEIQIKSFTKNDFSFFRKSNFSIG